MMQEKILSVSDLHVKFRLRGRVLHALRGVSLDVYKGEPWRLWANPAAASPC